MDLSTQRVRDAARRMLNNVDYLDEQFGDYRVKIDHSILAGRRVRVYNEDGKEVFKYRL